MSTTTTTQITRRGFSARKYPVPPSVRRQAEEVVARHANDPDFPVERIIATLRTSTWIGAGCPAESGAYVLELVLYYPVGSSQCALTTIYPREGVVISFQRPDNEGWRWAPGWRTRREASGWILQRWTGEDWSTVELDLGSYAAVRRTVDEREAS